MNANCIICSDLFQPRSDIYTTSCGHLFHFLCLIQWIERSKTCPQCRHKETEKTIHRVFFNIQSTEHIPDNIVTLQAKLDNENFQLKLKSKERLNNLEEYRKCNTNSKTLSDLTMGLQEKAKANKLAIRQMKEQVKFYQEKLTDKEKYVQEIHRLQTYIENMQHTRTVINGCQEQVEDIIKESKDAKSLCLFVAILQKELTDQDRKMQKLASQLRLNKSDYNEVRAQAFVLKKKYEDLKKAQEAHESCPAKLAALKEQLADLLAKKDDVNPNDSINRVIFESPAPSGPDFNRAYIDVDTIESPTVTERVAQIKASDSPYLAIKSTVGNSYGHLLQAKYKIPTKGATNASASQNVDKYSIFSKKIVAGPSKTDYSYNGLGGHSRAELFPKPSGSTAGSSSVKRNKSSVSNLKFKKLNPKAVSAFTITSSKK